MQMVKVANQKNVWLHTISHSWVTWPGSANGSLERSFSSVLIMDASRCQGFMDLFLRRICNPSMVQGTLHIFFRNKTFLFVKIESWNFQQLFDLGFCETLKIFSSFRQTFRWHFCIGNKELSKLAEILWGFTKF